MNKRQLLILAIIVVCSFAAYYGGMVNAREANTIELEFKRAEWIQEHSDLQDSLIRSKHHYREYAASIWNLHSDLRNYDLAATRRLSIAEQVKQHGFENLDTITHQQWADNLVESIWYFKKCGPDRGIGNRIIVPQPSYQPLVAFYLSIGFPDTDSLSVPIPDLRIPVDPFLEASIQQQEEFNRWVTNHWGERWKRNQQFNSPKNPLHSRAGGNP